MLIKVNDKYVETTSIAYIEDLRPAHPEWTVKTKIKFHAGFVIETGTPVEELISPHAFCDGLYCYGKAEGSDVTEEVTKVD